MYMLFAGWEVRILKNCGTGFENCARARTPQVWGHSYSLFEPTFGR